MDSKRLPFSGTITPLSLSENIIDIEVPAGEIHYHLDHITGHREHIFHLHHPGTILRITGSVKTQGDSSLTLTTIHHAPHTKAETIIRTLGIEESRSMFKGMIKIDQGASGCESYLNHHSLLFDTARSYTWPALEIGNNEVKCSHAATIKTITDSDMFYARSRGISKVDAKNLMIEAFFADVQN